MIEESKFQVSTMSFRSKFLKEKNFPSKIEVFPIDNNLKWNYRNLSLFLNELTNFTKANHPYTLKEDLNSKTACFYFKNIFDESCEIFIHVNSKITVSISSRYIINNWANGTRQVLSKFGAQNKILKKARLQKFVFYYKLFDNISDTSNFLFSQNNSILYFIKTDFSEIFNFFAKRIFLFGLPFTKETEAIHKYLQSFIVLGKMQINSFQDLVNLGLKGYLKLMLQPKTSYRRLPVFSIKEDEYYITGGVFIMPQTKWILNNLETALKGFIMDTTWKAMSRYVTSIITATYMNSSFPLGFSFGRAETKKQYKLLLDTIMEQAQYNFAGKVLESDQGPALLGICSDYSMQHLTCLHHLLKGFKKLKYSYEMQQLVTCASEFEKRNCFEFFSTKFSEIISKNSKEKKSINNCLKKIGLRFDGEIYVSNIPKWTEVSMISRKDFAMPSTTNTLEAMHGQINRHVPRNNGFYPSILRLHNEMNDKYKNIVNQIKHNYSSLKLRVLKEMKKFNKQQMEQMIAFYDTSIESCQCSQNQLESANYQMDIPCMHRVYLGAEFPALPDIEIDPELQYDTLEIDYDLDTTEENIHHDCLHDDKEYAYQTIKFFTRSKKDEKIKSFINSFHKSDEERDGFFILNREISVIEVISEGIRKFRTVKRNK